MRIFKNIFVKYIKVYLKSIQLDEFKCLYYKIINAY